MMLVSNSSNSQKQQEIKGLCHETSSLLKGVLLMSKIRKTKTVLKRQEKSYFEGFYQEVDSYDAETFQLIINKCKQPKLVIEIGCGSGAWTAHVAKLGGHVIGLDLSLVLAKKMHKRLKLLNCEAVVGDAEFLPFKDRVADYCFFFFSLHHIPDLYQAITEATRCLKDDGWLIMVEPNGLNFMLTLTARITSILKLVNKAGMTSPAERPLNIIKIVRMLSKLGFKCQVLPCYATLRKKSQETKSSLQTRIYWLTLKISPSIFPKIFGASDFILFAEKSKRE